MNGDLNGITSIIYKSYDKMKKIQNLLFNQTLFSSTIEKYVGYSYINLLILYLINDLKLKFQS
jgi:hypothetical protein